MPPVEEARLTRIMSEAERAALPEAAKMLIFPFEGDLKVKRLDAPVLPEPPRIGDPRGEPCSWCELPDSNYLWTDEHWRLSKSSSSTGVPFVGMLQPRGHYDLGDLPPTLAATLGPTIVRVERAIRTIEGIERVHVNRWGDGVAHLHLCFFARPAGMLQLRGLFLPVWNEILPRLPEAHWRENLRRIATALAAGGGTAHC